MKIDIDNSFEEFVEETMEVWHSPGLSMAIIQGDEIVYSNGFGYSNLKEKTPVNPDTLFVAASTTKAFTATALGILVDDGLFDWNTPILKYLPDLHLEDILTARDITAVDLLAHRSGYPRHDKVWYGSHKKRADLIQALRYLQPNAGFRSVWQYNNLMYVLAGHLVEVLSGKTWEEFLQERILDPAGMKRSNFSVNQMQEMENASLGYAWKEDRYEQVAYRYADTIGPAGSLNTCGNDMARWIQLQMAEGCLGDRQIVSRESLAKIHTPVMVAPSFLPGKYEEILHTQYGLGWFCEVYRGKQIFYHVGNLDGFYALVSFMPEYRLGHVILTNMTPNRAPYVLSYSLYDRFLQFPAVDWNEMIGQNVQRQEEEEMRNKEKQKEKRIPNTNPSFALQEYAGVYHHPGYGEVLVGKDDKGLTLNFNEFTTRLTHFHYDVFVCDGPEKGFPGLTLATFTPDRIGQVSMLSIPFEPAPGAKEILFAKLLR